MEALISTEVRNPLAEHLPVLAAAALGLALYGDRALTIKGQQRFPDNTPTIAHNNGANQLTMVIAGCRTEAQAIERLLEPELQNHSDTAYFSYAKRGAIIPSLGKAILNTRHELGTRKPLAIVGLSMGPLALAELFDDPSFKDALGPIDTLVMDSSPSGMHTVKRPIRTSLGLANRVQYSSTANLATRVAIEMGAKKRAKHHGPQTTDEIALYHHKSTARTPLSSVVQQGYVIANGKPQNLHGAAEQTFYLHGQNDKVIDTNQASADYSQHIPQLRVVLDSTRPIGSHAASPEYPDRLLELLRS